MTEAAILVTGTWLDPAAARRLQGAGYTAIYAHDRTASAELAALAAEHRVRGLIVRQGTIDAQVIGASDRLAVISRHGSGVDRIDLEAAARAGIPVLRAHGANAQSVAEHALGFILSLLKELPRMDASIRAGQWLKPGHVGRDLAGAELGIVGYGAVGRRLAAITAAIGARVQVYDPKPVLPEAPGIRATTDLTRLVETAEIVSLHCPLHPGNRHLFDARLIARMRPGALLINTARGGLVDETALIAALAEGRLAGAALDTFEDEPLPPGHPLRERPEVLLSPHVAGAGRQGMTAMALQSVENLLAVLSGRPVAEGALVTPPPGPRPLPAQEGRTG